MDIYIGLLVVCLIMVIGVAVVLTLSLQDLDMTEEQKERHHRNVVNYYKKHKQSHWIF